jgi:hypothetical protein
LGRSTSSTSIPLAFRCRASLRLRSCWYLLPQRTSRGRNPPPNGGAPRNPSRSLARWTRPGFSAQMVHGHRHLEAEVRCPNFSVKLEKDSSRIHRHLLCFPDRKRVKGSTNG